MVSANSRYIEEQQEQQQVETYKQEEAAGRQEAGRKRKKGEVLVISVVFWFYTLDLNLSLKWREKWAGLVSSCEVPLRPFQLEFSATLKA